MIAFEQMGIRDGVPLYLQIVQYFRRGIAAGTVENGDELPSRRVLSALLGVNPNTVQKAYRLLEEEGLIESHTGAKSYAVVTETQIKRLKSELVREELLPLVRDLRQSGLRKEEVLQMIDTMWEESL